MGIKPLPTLRLDVPREIRDVDRFVGSYSHASFHSATENMIFTADRQSGVTLIYL